MGQDRQQIKTAMRSRYRKSGSEVGKLDRRERSSEQGLLGRRETEGTTTEGEADSRTRMTKEEGTKKRRLCPEQ